VLFGSDWLTNFYMGCFLFGLIFTALSLFLNMSHLGGGPSHHGDVGHALHGGHDAGHAHGGDHAHGAAPDHGDSVNGLSPLNLPTILAFVTWFGGAGYIFRTSLGLDGVITVILALISGLLGGAILFLFLSRVLWAGQTTPMRRADFYLPGTRARVVSAITPGGAGEIVFMKGGGRRVEGARGEGGAGIAQGVEVEITRYERGMAYVQAITTTADLPPPVAARAPAGMEAPTQPLNGSGAALTRDLGKRP
jgi:hypothetical protein